MEYSPIISKKSKRQIIAIAYNPHKQFKEIFIEDTLKGIDYAASEARDVTILGDFNINYLNKHEAKFLSDSIKPYNLSITNKSIPTYNSKNSQSILDNIIATKSLCKETIVAEPPINTDHLITMCISKLKRFEKAIPIRTFRFDKTNYCKNRFCEELKQSPWFLVYQENDISKMLIKFEDIFSHALNAHAPLEQKYIRNKPQLQLSGKVLNSVNRPLKQEKENLLKAYQLSRTDANFENYKRIRNKYNNHLKHLYKKEKTAQFKMLDCPKKQWNFINSIRNTMKQSTQIGDLRNSFGDTIIENKNKANFLNYRFSTLGEYKNADPPIDVPTEYSVHSKTNRHFQFRFITHKEMKDAVLLLPLNKPLGPSKIPAWALKDSINTVNPILTMIINECISKSVFPYTLKKAHVFPIFKKGDSTDPVNYRPISITPTLSKLFEKIFSSQIHEFLANSNILNPKQFGFRPGYSTNDALLYTTEKIRFHLDKNNIAAAAFLDLSKAFDSLSHSVLERKLSHIGFEQSATTLIKSFLENRQQLTIVNGEHSDWLKLEQGVPQGTVLGPLLFNLYVNDLPQTIDKSCTLVQYADDTTLLSFHSDPETATKSIENNFNKILLYFHLNRLMINVDKTQFIVFSAPSKKKLTENLSLKVGNYQVNLTETVKFLGVNIDISLTFDKEINKILQKMATAIQTIKCIRDDIPLRTRILLLNTLVLSHLHYPCMLLNGCTQDNIEKLEKQIKWGIRIIMNISKRDSVTLLRKQHKIPTARNIIEYRSAHYLHRLCRNDAPAFTHIRFPNSEFRYNHRTGTLLFPLTCKTDFLRKSFLFTSIRNLNTIIRTLFNRKLPYTLTKTLIKNFIIGKDDTLLPNKESLSVSKDIYFVKSNI